MSTVLLSDAHLGHVCSRPDRLLDLLTHLPDDCERLIVVGDLGDQGNGVDAAGFAVWWRLQTLSQQIEVVLLLGNHDADNRQVAALLGLCGPKDNSSFRWESGGKTFVATHGHRHPVTHVAWDPYEAHYFAGHFYPTACLNALERSLAFWGWNPGLTLARWFHGLRKYCTPGVRRGCREGALAYAKEVGAACVFYGHTHCPEYYSGDIVTTADGLFEDYPLMPVIASFWPTAVNLGACGAERVLTYAVEREGVVTLHKMPGVCR